jgi:hypothetical protein
VSSREVGVSSVALFDSAAPETLPKRNFAACFSFASSAVWYLAERVLPESRFELQHARWSHLKNLRWKRRHTPISSAGRLLQSKYAFFFPGMSFGLCELRPTTRTLHKFPTCLRQPLTNALAATPLLARLTIRRSCLNSRNVDARTCLLTAGNYTHALRRISQTEEQTVPLLGNGLAGGWGCTPRMSCWRDYSLLLYHRMTGTPQPDTELASNAKYGDYCASCEP